MLCLDKDALVFREVRHFDDIRVVNQNARIDIFTMLFQQLKNEMHLHASILMTTDVYMGITNDVGSKHD